MPGDPGATSVALVLWLNRRPKLFCDECMNGKKVVFNFTRIILELLKPNLDFTSMELMS